MALKIRTEDHYLANGGKKKGVKGSSRFGKYVNRQGKNFEITKGDPGSVE